MGRQSKYETHVKPFLEDIKQMYEFMNEGDIARQLNINPNTFSKYKQEHSELAECFLLCKAKLIADLKMTLKKKAKGFTYTEIKKTVREVDGVRTQVVEEYEKYSPPDTGAIHLLLKNLDDGWHNDDTIVLGLKEREVKLKEEKAEENW